MHSTRRVTASGKTSRISLKAALILIFIFAWLSVFSQTITDSLVRFSELKFHSEFERDALQNFVKNHKDTFNLFLAIDEKMTRQKAAELHNVYKTALQELKDDNIQSKKINNRIRTSYSTIHARFLKKYNSNEYFPVTFQTGSYNCVSASMLYALIFDNIQIPYRVMVSPNHVYLVANPGSNSVVIETTNPGFENTILNGEFKQQYVNSLRISKLISEEEYKNKSVDEIFEQKFKEVNEATFVNLPGFQYYNKAVSSIQNNASDVALCQKAYFFYPDEKVKMLLYNSLLTKISQCDFDQVSDIDYLSQFSRFENVESSSINKMFYNVMLHFLQYTDKEKHCDSLYRRFISGINDKRLQQDVIFSYNIQMSYHYQKSDEVVKYVAKALEIKGNYKDAAVIFENYLRQKLYNNTDPKAMLDTLTRLESRYNFKAVTSILKKQKLIAYLKFAVDSYDDKKISAGDQYLQQFESSFTPPPDDPLLDFAIEKAYHTAALYYYQLGNKSKMKSYVERGLKYEPNSKALKSLIN